jgi:hypothetical protein
MSAAHDLLAELERHHVHVERHGDRLKMRAPAPPPGDLLARINANKAALLDTLPDADARQVLHFRLPGHPVNAWATYIGRPGESREQVQASLVERWPVATIRRSGQADTSASEGTR